MKTFVFVFLMLLILPEAHSQSTLTQTVKGTIKDASSKSSLIGATIIVEGSNPVIGTTTGADGEFRMEKVPVGRHNLSVSYIGYKPFIVSEILVSSGKED